jgi:DNA-binding response OmpR family regulator
MRTEGDATPRILLVEDDSATAEMLVHLLESQGYRVDHAPNARDARAQVDQAYPDLVILDIMLPDESGLVLCAEFRAYSDVRILLLSGTRRRSDRIIGLRLGACDFIAKPFSVDELLAGINAVLDCVAPCAAGPSSPCGSVLRIDELMIDQRRVRVALGGQTIHLTRTEYRLLAMLASRPGEIVSRRLLSEQVWGLYDAAREETLAVHIRKLRQKLKVDSERAPQLLTMRGRGYKLSPSGGGAKPSRMACGRHTSSGTRSQAPAHRACRPPPSGVAGNQASRRQGTCHHGQP